MQIRMLKTVEERLSPLSTRVYRRDTVVDAPALVAQRLIAEGSAVYAGAAEAALTPAQMRTLAQIADEAQAAQAPAEPLAPIMALAEGRETLTAEDLEPLSVDQIHAAARALSIRIGRKPRATLILELVDVLNRDEMA